MLLRVLKRTSAVRVTDPYEFCRLEFWDRARGGPDLALSVYEAHPEEATQLYAEHAAAAGMDPPREGALLDVDDGRARAHVRADPREGAFGRTDGAHHELVFGTGGEVLAYVEGVHRTLAARLVPVPRHAVTAYVRARLEAGDREWEGFVAQAPKGDRWR